jgi:glyoxylate/hydroxypyruvate reductase A
MKPPCVALVSGVIDMCFLMPVFETIVPGIDMRITDALGERGEIELAVCWAPPQGLLASMPNLRLIQSIGAGVDHILKDSTLPPKPVCRIVDPDMTAGMTAYVCWAVINRQRRFPAYCAHSAAGVWQEEAIEPPSGHCVGIAGLGRLGTALAQALVTIGYRVQGWSRLPKTDPLPGVTHFHGKAGLEDFLAQTDTLVCLLPLTDETTGFLGRETFGLLPPGAHVINVGRGAHLVERDLLDALASGHLSGATLDTNAVEPLPQTHPFWRHPQILVTPHIASRTSPMTIARQTLDNYRHVCEGRTPPGQIDPRHGY